MLALDNEKNNDYVEFLSQLMDKIKEKLKAILFISAHWYINNDEVDVLENPNLIYDFYGFSNELYQVKYESKWFSLWEEVVNKVFWINKYKKVKRWLDYWVWTILKHIDKNSQIPLFVLSINRNNSLEEIYNLWQKIKELRKEGIMIIWSWNLVHNLWYLNFSLKNYWYTEAHNFMEDFRKALKNIDYEKLFNPHTLSWWDFAVPTMEYYIPAIFIIGTLFDHEKIKILFDDFELWSISRTAFWVI